MKQSTLHTKTTKAKKAAPKAKGKIFKLVCLTFHEIVYNVITVLVELVLRYSCRITDLDVNQMAKIK